MTRECTTWVTTKQPDKDYPVIQLATQDLSNMHEVLRNYNINSNIIALTLKATNSELRSLQECTHTCMKYPVTNAFLMFM